MGWVITAVLLTWLLRAAVLSSEGADGSKLHSSDSFVVGTAWLLFIPTGIAGLHWAAEGSPFALFLVGPAAVFLFPWLIAEKIFIPLGLPGFAAALVPLARVRWPFKDQGEGRPIAALLARLHQKSPDAWWLIRAEELLNSHALGGSGVVARGLVALVKGRRDDARSLFQCALHFDARTTGSAAERLAREWLAADAAARGEWRAVIRVGGAGRRSRATVLLTAIARRLLAEPGSPGDLVLWLRWLAAPARRRSLPLLRRALGTPLPSPSARRSTFERGSTATLREAMARLAALLRRPGGRVTLDEVTEAALTWDTALVNPEVVDSLLRAVARREARGVTDPAATLRESVAVELAKVLREHDLPLPSGPARHGILERTVEVGQAELLSAVELAADRLRGRVEARRELLPIEELRAWQALAELYSTAKLRGGREVQQLLFGLVNQVVCEQAVWLHNMRGEVAIANACFRWLLAEATEVGDSSARELAAKNSECGS